MKLAAALFALLVVSVTDLAHAAEWTPAQWVAEDTLEFRTDCPDEGEHWSYVWLVVLDGDVWVRLGSRAANRFDCSSTRPLAGIRIGGQEFAAVEMVDTPAMVERVDAAMAEKYTSDVFIRPFAKHPYTMKLVPKTE